MAIQNGFKKAISLNEEAIGSEIISVVAAGKTCHNNLEVSNITTVHVCPALQLASPVSVAPDYHCHKPNFADKT